MIESSDSDEPTPFSLHRVISREYHVGKEGVVIGSGDECDVRLPLEAALEERHVEIRWVRGK